MIPRLYDTIYNTDTQTLLGWLPDAIECIVTEERNGIYELSMKYPVGGVKATEIEVGRVIVCAGSSSSGEQPFRIDEVNKGLNTIDVHANHISYDLLYHYKHSGSLGIDTYDAENIMSSILTDAIDYYADIYWTAWSNITTTVDEFSFDSPRTCKNALGGSEGSVLDTFGGEFEWDNFTVKLWSSRGSTNPTPIYYGSNIISFDSKVLDDAYTDVVAYVVIDEESLTSSQYRISGYDTTQQTKVLLLDWSEKYEEMPTLADLNTAVSAYASSGANVEKTQTYEVTFVPMSADTLSLCDTVTVHGKYGEEITAKVTRTDWNVLRDRYESITVGDLPQTLGEAITDSTVAEVTTSGVSSVNGMKGDVIVTADNIEYDSTYSVYGKIASIVATGGEPNVIEVVKQNGVALTVTDKTVNVTVPTAVSELTNDSGYITDAGVTSFNGSTGAITYSAPVTSVNGDTGAVTVDVPTAVSELTNDAGYITDAGVTSFNGSTGAITYTAPVTSVNGSTGAVTISIPTAVSELTNDAGYITSVTAITDDEIDEVIV